MTERLKQGTANIQLKHINKSTHQHMKRTTSSNIQLGSFVMVGLAFLLAALYLIGKNRNLFDQTFEVNATFYNVNGLMKGNNVRFSGIDVGTIKRVEIVSDTSVRVTMIIEKRIHSFIKKNSVASVGTDGLMGNKLVNITNTSASSNEIIAEGDMLLSVKPVETDDMLRTLDQTNTNLYHISNNLKKITQKLNNSNSLWSILMDTTVAQNVKQSIASIRLTARNTTTFTNDLNYLLQDLKNGKGLAGSILRDSLTASKFKSSIQQLHDASEKAFQVTTDIKQLTEKIKKGEGGAGILLSDSVFAKDLQRSMHNIQQSTDRFDQNMEALKHNFLFRGYFRRQEKELKKIKEDSIERLGNKK
jgi:phospholipid/cholesterol/gamma-HCH transport system substrate-binding protein